MKKYASDQVAGIGFRACFRSYQYMIRRNIRIEPRIGQIAPENGVTEGDTRRNASASAAASNSASRALSDTGRWQIPRNASTITVIQAAFAAPSTST